MSLEWELKQGLRRGIRRGISDAVSGAVQQAVAPAAQRVVDKTVAPRVNHAADSINQQYGAESNSGSASSLGAAFAGLQGAGRRHPRIEPTVRIAA